MNRCVACVGVAALVSLATFVQAAPPTYRDAVAAANPILWYRLNEASGNVVNYGSLGVGQNAFSFGNVSRGIPSPGGGPSGDAAFGFGVGTDFLESLAPSPLVGNPTFSIEAVVRLDGSAVANLWGPFLHWGDGPAVDRTGREVYFGIQGTNNRLIYAGFYNAGVRTSQQLPLNRWLHVVWTRAGGTDSESGSTIYINGSPVATQRDQDLSPGFVPADQLSINAAPFRVNAGRDFPGQRYFSGALDELALYNRLLTPAEIAQRARLALCRGDFNADGSLNSQDFFDFLNGFFALDAGADFNADGAINSQDFFDFLAAFFAGC